MKIHVSLEENDSFVLSELHRCAVFCLLQCGTQIYDTDLVMVDRTLTDICFEDTVVLYVRPV